MVMAIPLSFIGTAGFLDYGCFIGGEWLRWFYYGITIIDWDWEYYSTRGCPLVHGEGRGSWGVCDEWTDKVELVCFTGMPLICQKQHTFFIPDNVKTKDQYDAPYSHPGKRY